ncbi:hypothetical protein [Actinopolymorpha pittospori]
MELTEESIDFYANDTHPGRIIEACWRLSQKGRQPADEWRDGWYYALRRWAHMLGYGVGDAMLANTAAAMAHERRQTGRLEIATSG